MVCLLGRFCPESLLETGKKLLRIFGPTISQKYHQALLFRLDQHIVVQIQLLPNQVHEEVEIERSCRFPLASIHSKCKQQKGLV